MVTYIPMKRLGIRFRLPPAKLVSPGCSHMRRRVSIGMLGFCLACSLNLCSLPSALAQVSFVEPTRTANADVSDVLDRGRTLESQRRWGEALTLYEDAARSYPDDPALLDR